VAIKCRASVARELKTPDDAALNSLSLMYLTLRHLSLYCADKSKRILYYTVSHIAHITWFSQHHNVVS
jgi:hypothetical protein